MARYAILDTAGALIGVNVVAATPLDAAMGVLDQTLEEVASLADGEEGYAIYSLPTSAAGRVTPDLIADQGKLEAYVRPERVQESPQPLKA